MHTKKNQEGAQKHIWRWWSNSVAFVGREHKIQLRFQNEPTLGTHKVCLCVCVSLCVCVCHMAAFYYQNSVCRWECAGVLFGVLGFTSITSSSVKSALCCCYFSHWHILLVYTVIFYLYLLAHILTFAKHLLVYTIIFYLRLLAHRVTFSTQLLVHLVKFLILLVYTVIF